MGRPLVMLTLLALTPGLPRPAFAGSAGQPAANILDSARVELVRAPHKLLVGQRLRLHARVVDADGSVRKGARIAWRARASSYVSLAADGRITGVRPGKVGILAVSDGMSAETTVEVVDADIGSFMLNPAYAVARVGDTVHVTLDMRDRNGRPITGLMAEWQLSPEGGVIDDSGAFTAKMAGLYTILATIGDRKAVATVRVAPR